MFGDMAIGMGAGREANQHCQMQADQGVQGVHEAATAPFIGFTRGFGEAASLQGHRETSIHKQKMLVLVTSTYRIYRAYLPSQLLTGEICIGAMCVRVGGSI